MPDPKGCADGTRRRQGRQRLLGLLAVGLGWVALDHPASAQTVSPVGPDLRVGDLRGQFDAAFGNVSTPQARAFELTYGLGLAETYDDGVSVRNGFGSDLITRISPSVSFSANSNRIQGNVVYAPSLNLYTFHGNQSYVGQNLNASLTGTVVQDLFFIDVRGYAADQPSYGGQTVTTYGSQGQVQTTDFSITPRLEHRFGGTGTVRLSDTLDRTESSTTNTGNNSSINSSNNINSANYNPYLPQLVNGVSITNSQQANFTTGEDFGRLNDSTDFSASQTQGNGGVPSSHRLSFGTSPSYAVNRMLTLTSEIGHENISYSGDNGYNVDDLTWSLGVRLTPDTDTTLSISYGHHDGADALDVTGSLAPTARSRVFLRYGQSVGTQQEQLQNNLAATRTSTTGVSYDPVTGAPVQVNNNFATGSLQQPVYRTTTASASGVLNYDRDVFSASIEHDDQDVLSGGQTSTLYGAATSTSGYSGSLAWTHTASPDLFTNASLQYSVRSAPFRQLNGATTGQQSTLTFNVTANYILSQTVTAQLQYTRINTTGVSYGQPPHHDIATLSLQKTF